MSKFQDLDFLFSARTGVKEFQFSFDSLCACKPLEVVLWNNVERIVKNIVSFSGSLKVFKGITTLNCRGGFAKK